MAWALLKCYTCGSLTRLAGQALLTAGNRHVSLHVSPDNKGAIHLYDSVGFRLERELQDYYAPGRHALRMCWEASRDAVGALSTVAHTLQYTALLDCKWLMCL